MKPETRIFSPATEPEDDFFNGYRRVQVISQPLGIFEPIDFPPHHFEAFRHFVGLFQGLSADALPFLLEMREIHMRVDMYLLLARAIPSFSSFSRMKQWQKQTAEELSLLTRDTDYLFQAICEDKRSSSLAQYMSESKSPAILHDAPTDFFFFLSLKNRYKTQISHQRILRNTAHEPL